MDRGSLYKLALSYLGIADYVPGSPEEQALRDVEQHAIALAAAYTPWRWAQRTATLSLSNGRTTLPDDCLELRYCSLPQWELIGRDIITKSPAYTSAEIIYSSTAWADSLSVPDHQPLFADGLALLLAAKAAVRITSSHQLAAALEQQANQAFYRAKLAEVRAVHSNDQQATWKDSLPWVTT